MKLKSIAHRLLVAVAFLGFVNGSYAMEETTGEKVGEKMHDLKRVTKKGVHRIEEKLCAKGDLQCAKLKAENRVDEAGTYLKDKTKEMKEHIDTNTEKK